MVEVTVTVIDKNKEVIEDSDLLEDAIQLFFDKCDLNDISIDEGIERLHWTIVETADRLSQE